MEIDNGASVSLLADMIHTNVSPTRAINPQDALEALRPSVGLTTIGGSKTALDFIAADPNQNAKVAPQDALDILKYSVGLRELDTDWMFVDNAGDYSGITKGNVSFTEGVSLDEISSDTSVGLTSILLGDVNDTYPAISIVVGRWFRRVFWHQAQTAAHVCLSRQCAMAPSLKLNHIQA
ncbi:MAG: hypothetical protein P8M25_07660 [Paracoccaceae bacterium]|nr:hypothetical protein [Paracoccaceae bacterium]